jgi:alpha-tubulin suppressor-like RCC1 family protein
MSSNLWRYYLENDVERFQRLLSGASLSHRGQAQKSSGSAGLTTPTGSYKTPSHIHHANREKNKHDGTQNTQLTAKQLRDMDLLGRTVLHRACTDQGRLEFVIALLQHPQIDPAITDLESGWTALHRALYHGNISAAREIMSAAPGNWSLVKLKDHAGDSPWEGAFPILSTNSFSISLPPLVFESTVQEIHEPLKKRTVRRNSSSSSEHDNDSEAENTPSEDSIGEELFTWGSNKNLNLGFVGGNDSAYPERVPLARPRSLLLEQARQKYGHLPGSEQKTDEELLDASILFDPIQVSDIQLSKFHTAVLTTDPHSNLFICGFGRGGRLGFGEEQDVQYTLRPLLAPLLPKKKVEVVALGQDHTIAVLEDGEVFTWGSNTHGQLGYAVPQKHAREEPIQATPRQVFGLIKREPIIGAAASRVHTAVFTRDSLYTWGKNDGQLGILDSSDSATLEIQTTPRKVSANFLTGQARIRDVVAVDKATVILLESREVWILAGGGYSRISRISFPVDDGFQLLGGSGSKFTTTPRYGGDAQGNKIDKISGGGDTVAFLSDVGAVFALDVDAVLKDRTSRAGGKTSSSWQSHRVWSLRKRHMAVRDFDVGADGNIIICTQSGSVWRRVKRVKLKESGNAGGDGSRYKFTRIPGLTRVTTVRSNTAGAFAAVRQDCSLLRTSVKVDPPTLWEDIGNLMPLMGIFKKHQEVAMPPLVKSDENWEHGYHNFGPIPKPEWFEGAYCWFMEGGHEGDLRDHLENLWSQGLRDVGDVLISTDMNPDLEIPVHGCILARSLVLRGLLSRPDEATVEGLLTLSPSPSAGNGNRTLILHSINLLTLLNILYYLYLDTLIDLWHQRSLPKPTESFYKSLRSEMLLLATKLELSHLQEAVGRMHYPHRSLDADLLGLLQDPSYLKATADLVLECKDGEIMVHSTVMRARCPFFETLYKGGAQGRWLEGRKNAGMVRVDMRHITLEVMRMVVEWVYADWSADGKGQGFDGCKAGVQEGDVDLWLDFVVGVMEVADEVLVGRLQQVCYPPSLILLLLRLPMLGIWSSSLTTN